MPEYVCPACEGGFPGDALLDGAACPWCHHMLADRNSSESVLEPVRTGIRPEFLEGDSEGV